MRNKLNYPIVFTVLMSLSCFSCKDFLDIVPDDIPTIDHAFENRYQAEGFLLGIYSFLPNFSQINGNPGLTCGDEVWLIDPLSGGIDPYLWGIARGEQGTNEPIANYWSSHQEGGSTFGGKRLFTGIRDANIFLENIDIPFDLGAEERTVWIAEVKFLKAFFHFWLLRMYGPIPIIDENISMGASVEESLIYREPIDEVVDYIVNLLDECAVDLPMDILDITNYMGRPTKPIALALKAQVLTLAASPLFNGNTDYAEMVDNRGINLFPIEYNHEKWKRAAEALREAIEISHDAGHELFDFNTVGFSNVLNDSTVMAMQVRGAVVERWNSEIIWGDPSSNTSILQRLCQPMFTSMHIHGQPLASYAPPMRIIEQFYSKNGVPIEEDIEWEGVDWLEIKNGDLEHKYYIKEGYPTIKLHFNREVRFYGAISFDGSRFYGNGRHSDDENLFVTNLTYGYEPASFVPDRHSSTGYLVKKLSHYLTSIAETSTSLSTYNYSFPIIRLADLYLMYAEALNEVKDTPDSEVYEYIDIVRNRSGLEGVINSWQNYSLFPDKPKNKEGMREIIRRERLNELAFEGSRFWDLRRWKLSEQFMNKPIRGLNILEKDPVEFYKVQDIFYLSFEKKDYLWPIRQSELLKNKNLVQNPGW